MESIRTAKITKIRELTKFPNTLNLKHRKRHERNAVEAKIKFKAGFYMIVNDWLKFYF